MPKFKKGDKVRVLDDSSGYGIYKDILYEVVGYNPRNNLPFIRSTDPVRKISETICETARFMGYKDTTDWYEDDLEVDKEWMDEKMNQLFG